MRKLLYITMIYQFIFFNVHALNERVQEKPFVIIIPSYNNEQWYYNNLKSVISQNYHNFRVIYINDASTDKTYTCVQEFFNEHKAPVQIEIYNNTKRLGACANYYYAIHLCEPHEIIIMLDGDDWLAHENVLSYLNGIYQNENIWLTYGQYKSYPENKPGGARALPEEVIAHAAYRKYDWVTTHLRSLYAGLFHKIKPEDLQRYPGIFFESAWDLATMYPCLEMAGEHSMFIPDVLYIYNRANSLNTDKMCRLIQSGHDKMIREKQKYAKITHLF